MYSFCHTSDSGVVFHVHSAYASTGSVGLQNSPDITRSANACSYAQRGNARSYCYASWILYHKPSRYICHRFLIPPRAHNPAKKYTNMLKTYALKRIYNILHPNMPWHMYVCNWLKCKFIWLHLKLRTKVYVVLQFNMPSFKLY